VPVVVGIAGGSASGKTTIAAALTAALEQADLRVGQLATDPYMFQDIERGPAFRLSLTGEVMFDCNRPESFDWAAVMRDLELIVDCDVVLVEGLMVLHVEEIRDRLDLRLFVELDADERALRRLLRDMSKPRGLKDPAKIAAYYRESARIGHAQFIEPSRVHADLIVRGDAPVERIVPMLVGVVEKLSHHSAVRPSS
jgi:uridine kinase